MLANRRHSSPSIFKDFRQEINRQNTSSEVAKLRTLSVCCSKTDPIKQSIKSPSSVSGNDFLASPTAFSPRESNHDIPSHLKQPPIINTANIIKLTSPPRNRMEMKKSKSKCVKPTLAKPRIGNTLPLSKRESLSSESEEYNKKVKSKRTNDTNLLSPNNTNYLSKIFRFEPQRLDFNNNANSGDEEIASINLKGSSFSPLHTGDFQRSPSPRSPLKTPPTPGVVVTSYRLSQRRSSITNAAIAFAAATAGATISPVASPKSGFKFRYTLHSNFCNLCLIWAQNNKHIFFFFTILSLFRGRIGHRAHRNPMAIFKFSEDVQPGLFSEACSVSSSPQV